MKYQKSTNLLGATLDEIHKFITKKSVKVHDQSCSAADRYKPNKQIRFKTSTLRSDLCDYSDVYFVVKGYIVLTKAIRERPVGIRNRFLAFKNNATFTNCISIINNVLIDNAEDLDIVMPMYNLVEYSKNYKKSTGSFWNYYRNEPNNPPLNNYNADPITNSESFKYKSSITGKTSDENQENNENTKQGNTKIKKILKLLFH